MDDRVRGGTQDKDKCERLQKNKAPSEELSRELSCEFTRSRRRRAGRDNPKYKSSVLLLRSLKRSVPYLLFPAPHNS